ncbi:hypothetical protein GCM10022247_34880 [Allokutzneria multivorans]|uniref:Lipoprotein n=1 Tax=Allokutzneria multivorans TaxID=1142134 RepID=A0ABP7SC97_9PSEU
MKTTPTTNTPTPRRRRTLAALAATVILLASACTPPNTPPTTEGPDALDARRTDRIAFGLCSAYTVAALSNNTFTDTGPADARTRAAEQFGTPAFIRAAQGEGRDPLWPVLTEHRARVETTTESAEDDPPPATAHNASTAVLAHRTATNDSGWTQRLPSLVVHCSLARSTAGWRIAEVTVADSDSEPR